jgi:regulator of protease activity HflC (stomatin/prohibitin superfamily)
MLGACWFGRAASGVNGDFMMWLLPYLFVFLALLIIAAKSIVVAGEDERIVVFRLGKLTEVRGAGLSIIVPFLDRAVRVNVERIVDWKELSESELQKRAVEIALKEDRGETNTS